jgi:hypothetical protein
LSEVAGVMNSSVCFSLEPRNCNFVLKNGH